MNYALGWHCRRQGAMTLPCCKKSVCRSCAERGLIQSSLNGKLIQSSNQCGSDRYVIKDLEPNYTLRAAHRRVDSNTAQNPTSRE